MTRRLTFYIQPHIHDAFEEARMELGLSPSGAANLALRSFVEARQGGALVRLGDGSSTIVRKRGRPRLPPPPMPAKAAVVAALVAKGWLPANATTYAFEATWSDGAMGPYVAGHPEVVCWGLNGGHGLTPETAGLEPSAGPTGAPWVEVEGTLWRAPELIWGLEHGTWPAARLELLAGACHEGCHTCVRPDHYKVGASVEKFWRKKKAG